MTAPFIDLGVHHNPRGLSEVPAATAEALEELEAAYPQMLRDLAETLFKELRYMLRRNLHVSGPHGARILQQPIHKERVELRSENAVEVERGTRDARQDIGQREHWQETIADAERRRTPKVIKLGEGDADF